MVTRAANQLVFGRFRIDASEQTLWKGRRRLRITPKSLALLQYLARHAGRLIAKEELLDAIWADTHVGPGVLKNCVAEIRHALGDSANAPRFIEAVPRRGYRFVALVGIGNLPVPLTSFVGRDQELAEVTRLLGDGRLVSIWGPAGVGKTRLAIQVASHLQSEVPHGVWWIDLSPLVDPSLVAHTVAATLGVRDRVGLSVADALAKTLHERRLLLVFDNCEHLVDACASLADSLLRACPDLKILATSREPLGVTGERVWPLLPLSVPGSSPRSAELIASEAVRLFVERAKEASPFFALTDGNATAVADICRCLDGLPLAIELAAVRVKVLAPEQIAARLDDVLKLLVHESRTEPLRHQTLKAAFDWSCDLLSLKERRLLTFLSVFPGSFTLAAVESVCGGTEGFETEEMLDLMTRLIDRSLVTVATEPSAEETRYRLLGTVRQYARAELLPDFGAGLARRHAEFFLCVAEEVEPAINGAASVACVSRLNRERDNLRAALQWACQDESGGEIGARIAAALWCYWLRRGQLREGRDWLEATLPRGALAPARVKAQVLCGAGTLALIQGDREHARIRLEASVTLSRTTGDFVSLGRALYHLGLVKASFGDEEAAQRLTEEGVDVLRRADRPWDLAIALTGLGRVMRFQGRLIDSASLYQESAAILRAIPDPWTLSYPLKWLAALAAREGRSDLAEAYWRRVSRLFARSTKTGSSRKESRGWPRFAPHAAITVGPPDCSERLKRSGTLGSHLTSRWILSMSGL